MRLLITICLLMSLSAGAQTANVIELTPVDAARAQKAWDALQKAQVEWDAVQKDVDKQYLQSLKSANISCNDKRCVPSEYSGGFEFSKDFKVIVPKAQTWTTSGGTIVPTYPCYPGWNWTPCTGTNCGIKYN